MSEKKLTVSDLKRQLGELQILLEEKDEFCRNSREQFHKALLASPDPVSITEIETGRYIDVNDNFIKEIEYTREELIGKTSLELGIWKKREEREAFTDLFRKNGYVKEFEVEFVKKSGNTGIVLMSCEKIVVDNRDCLLTYCRRITEIRKTEDHYRLLAENITDVIWTMQLDGRFSYISPSVKALRGFTPEEVMKQRLDEVLTPESAKKVQILLQELVKNTTNGQAYNDSYLTEVEQIRKDGSTVWTEVITSPVFDRRGKLTSILGVSRNIQGKKIAEQKAREYTKKIEGVFRSAPLGMGMIVDRTIVEVNDRFCIMTGYTRKEVLGKNTRFLYESIEEYNRVGAEKYDLVQEKGIGDIHTRLIRKDRSAIEVIISSSPIDINDLGKGMIFNVLDITELRDAKVKLALNETKYSSFFNHINDAILVHPWKEEGFHKFVEVNDIACTMYGYSREEFLNLRADNITIKEDIAEHQTVEFRSEIIEKGSMMFESVQIKKNGELFPVEISSNIITVDKKRYILAVVRDITERKRAEAAVRDSELRYREMFENSPEAMITLDTSGHITNCNSSFLEMTGMGRREVIDKHFAKTDLFSIRHLPRYLKLFTSILLKKEKQIIEYDWIHADGEQRKGVAHIGPILVEDKITGIQALLKDNTRQKDFESNLILSKERAEESDRLKSSFLETMSHELRTPLNAVIGFSNLIEEEQDIKNIREMNMYVTENSKKLLDIIESIFDISILETQTTALKAEEFLLSDLFAELDITLNGMLELENKNTIQTYFQPDKRHQDYKITTDKNRLKQLLTNLLTNAVRYTDHGSIRYGYSLVKGDIEFFVADTGIGIAPEKNETIFEKFSQIDSSATRKRGGLGLGLSICQEIAKLLSGSLRLESRPGKGSTFYFTISEKPGIIRSKSGYGIDLSGRSFLIVEDVESNYLYLEKLLTESGATVLWAQTGNDALAITDKIDKIDMILMDIRMPDMTGYEITRKIKELRSEIPIVAQTAYAMVSDQQEAIDAGCAAHISKPIRVEDLMNTIRQHLNIEKQPGILI